MRASLSTAAVNDGKKTEFCGLSYARSLNPQDKPDSKSDVALTLPANRAFHVRRRASTAIATNTIVRYVVDQWNKRIGRTGSSRTIRPYSRCASSRKSAPTTAAGTRYTQDKPSQPSESE